MLQVRRAQKLQKEIGVKPADLTVCRASTALFKEWYAHIFVLNRKKQVIFVETQTLFSFCCKNVPRKDIRERLSELFEKGLGKALYLEGVSGDVVSRIMRVCRGQFVFLKTENRRTIGALNEFVKQHKFSFYYQDRPLDIQDRCKRHMPMRGFPSGAKDYKFPIDVLGKLPKEQYDIDFVPDKKILRSIFSENVLEIYRKEEHRKINKPDW